LPQRDRHDDSARDITVRHRRQQIHQQDEHITPMSSEDLLGEIKHHNHINSALAQLDNLEDGTTSIQQLQGPASTVPPGDYEGKAFALLDKNNDGVIDHEEWRQAEVELVPRTAHRTSKEKLTSPYSSSRAVSNGCIDAFLEQLGLQEYVDKFRAEKVTLELLPHMSRDDFKDLGLPMGPRIAIWKELHNC